MSHDEQAMWLNSVIRFKLAPSKHGVGVFAIRDIPKGDKLYADTFPQLYTLTYASFNKLFPEIREMLLGRWPNVVNGSGFAWPDTMFQGYMNHSDDPNYDAKEDIALKDIKAGEEIVEDYRKITGWEKAYPWLSTPAT